jgi:endogenous inhibitor of DNA gyrase (YacG/DUF329 family)
MKVKCPTCGKSVEYSSENPFRPFCSQRCATLDLGAWADEKYTVPSADQEIDSVNEKSNEDSSETRESSRRSDLH